MSFFSPPEHLPERHNTFPCKTVTYYRSDSPGSHLKMTPPLKMITPGLLSTSPDTLGIISSSLLGEPWQHLWSLYSRYCSTPSSRSYSQECSPHTPLEPQDYTFLSLLLKNQCAQVTHIDKMNLGRWWGGKHSRFFSCHETTFFVCCI